MHDEGHADLITAHQGFKGHVSLSVIFTCNETKACNKMVVPGCTKDKS